MKHLISVHPDFQYIDPELDCWNYYQIVNRIPRDNRTGTASDHYRQFARIVGQAAKKDILHLLAVLYVRVSSGKQGRNGNAEHQLVYLRKRVKRIAAKYGVTIEIVDDGEFAENESAWKLWASGRPELVKAAKLAREKDAILVALNTSRLVRNRHHARGVMPTVADYEDLMASVGNVRLATVLHPDQHEDRSADTKRGFQGKNAKPGRKKKRHYGQRWEDLPKSIRRQIRAWWNEGLGNRKIAQMLGMKKSQESTIRGWRKMAVREFSRKVIGKMRCTL